MEEIKNEQDASIDTSLSLLKQILNPYPTEEQPQQPIGEQECIPESHLEQPTEIVSGGEIKRFSEGLEDLAEQSLISGSSHDTEVETEQIQPMKGVKICNY